MPVLFCVTGGSIVLSSAYALSRFRSSCTSVRRAARNGAIRQLALRVRCPCPEVMWVQKRGQRKCCLAFIGCLPAVHVPPCFSFTLLSLTDGDDNELSNAALAPEPSRGELRHWAAKWCQGGAMLKARKALGSMRYFCRSPGALRVLSRSVCWSVGCSAMISAKPKSNCSKPTTINGHHYRHSQK